ncbi:hypothetical protein HBI56_140850 [Parastagonospora nodorum]|uniref:Uncharacterized protein n=1 Tax=Phaeosphaeria nodorum (strain SN15 / ATCC MYA-4574 / FGSC 10173) TaxID=321614 RepID=A0A7U2I9L4_PHANO|nr:hypothetical protein HBH56_126980 [Parastagonospora nodorum]QRD05781.1 hypothetical protein JI435_422790 [Parastagonospora nodorum SN15]KAH3931425.1 hypothetical protein HBH54_096520 [Parastagonospora nodorum]KAH3947248.1 hypothetical protein HBH53_117240 [Parastagonospora nodorum]KAH3970713.1 hypothetical protein HBH51_113690 [Parastagonospora nodorum]
MLQVSFGSPTVTEVSVGLLHTLPKVPKECSRLGPPKLVIGKTARAYKGSRLMFSTTSILIMAAPVNPLMVEAADLLGIAAAVV